MDARTVSISLVAVLFGALLTSVVFLGHIMQPEGSQLSDKLIYVGILNGKNTYFGLDFSNGGFFYGFDVGFNVVGTRVGLEALNSPSFSANINYGADVGVVTTKFTRGKGSSASVEQGQGTVSAAIIQLELVSMEQFGSQLQYVSNIAQTV
jgi:hypothetical protein